MGTCRLCGSKARLVDSHVVPRALHLDMARYAGSDEAMRIYSDRLTHQPRSQTGVYGQFVCEDCEATFHPWDECGIAWVREYRDGDRGEPLLGDRRRGFSTQTGYTNFKLWIMSLLWRAHACEHDLYARIDLGDKWAEELADCLRNRDPKTPEYVAVCASWFNEEVGKHYMADPHPERYEGVNHVRFYVYGGFTFLIKVDQRKSPTSMRNLMLREDGSLPVLARRLSPSERRVAGNIFAAFTSPA